MFRQSAVVNIGTAGDARGGDGLVTRAAIHQQGCPLGNDLGVFAVLHALEQGLFLEHVHTLAHVLDVGLAPDERHVRNRVDEGLGVTHQLPGDEVRPELARNLELLVDGDGFRGLNRSVRSFGHVVELAQGRVTRTRVVPRVGALLSSLGKALENLNAPRRL